MRSSWPWAMSSGLLACNAIMTPTRQAYPLRLQLIYEELSVIIARYRPQEAAVEELFFGEECDHGHRGSTGARCCAADPGAKRIDHCRIHAKRGQAGRYGLWCGAKEQVGSMVRHLLALPAIPRPDDAADAAAIAICHAHLVSRST